MKTSTVNKIQRFILGMIGVFSLMIILFFINQELLTGDVGLKELKTPQAFSSTQGGYTPLGGTTLSFQPLMADSLQQKLYTICYFVSMSGLFILLIKWWTLVVINRLHKMEGLPLPVPNLGKKVTREFLLLVFFVALLMVPWWATQLISIFFPDTVHFFQ